MCVALCRSKTDPQARRATSDPGSPGGPPCRGQSSRLGSAALRGDPGPSPQRLPGRGPRRHLLERLARSAAQLFPAFFHNDFLKLLTRIVPHFSAAIPTPSRPPPGFRARGRSARPACTAPPTGCAPVPRAAPPRAGAQSPAAACSERPGPSARPLPALRKLWGCAPRRSRRALPRRCLAPASPRVHAAAPSRTEARSGARGAARAGLGEGLRRGAGLDAEPGTLRDSERDLERDSGRGAPPQPPVARSRGAVPSATPGQREQTLAPRGAGPWPAPTQQTREAAGTARTCARRRPLHPARRHWARWARRRRPARCAPRPSPRRRASSSRRCQAQPEGPPPRRRAALNPWGPGADGVWGTAESGASSRGPAALRRGTSVLALPRDSDPSDALFHRPPGFTSLQLGPLGSLVLAATPAYECPPEGVGKVDPSQVRGRCDSFSQATNGIPLVSLPSHPLEAEVRIAPSVLACVHTRGGKRGGGVGGTKGRPVIPFLVSLSLSRSLREPRSTSVRRCVSVQTRMAALRLTSSPSAKNPSF